MGTNSNDRGRAYEYAWMQALYEALNPIRPTKVVGNSSFVANERAWNTMSAQMKTLLTLSARSAVSTILELEPRMAEQGDVLFLQFQRDGLGTDGDVRDIVISRDDIRWEVGLSIKHNHEAIKHCRLSHVLDFGNEWFGVPCSSQYWSAVRPIFNRLTAEKRNGTSWRDIQDKSRGIYVPILTAFVNEVQRAYRINSDVPRKMVEYLVGVKDYYKVISHDAEEMTLIRTFNVHGTLNKPSKVRVSAITVPVVQLPTELISLRFKPDSDSTVEMYLNNGWQLSFRIHNASTRVEPSLKFDIQFIGMPVSVLSLECNWHR